MINKSKGLKKSLLDTKTKEMLNKVPEITVFFWLIKIMATTVGETAADFLNDNLNLGLTVTSIIMSVFLIVSIIFQFRQRKYVPSFYWLSVVLISVVGTLISDNLVDNLGVPLTTTTILFSIALFVSFVIWFISEKTLSVHTIFTAKREMFYWLTILFTFALGTSAGDLIAEGLNLGYFVSVLLFAGCIGLVAVFYYLFKINAVFSFWIAYILTRPLGASMGDLLSQSQKNGGLGLGTTGTSLLFLGAILVIVIYLTKSKRDVIQQIR